VKPKYKILVILALLMAVCTVVPAPASKPCPLGYYAHCSWTPWSTIICLAIAGALYWLGLKRSADWINGGRLEPVKKSEEIYFKLKEIYNDYHRTYHDRAPMSEPYITVILAIETFLVEAATQHDE